MRFTRARLYPFDLEADVDQLLQRGLPVEAADLWLKKHPGAQTRKWVVGEMTRLCTFADEVAVDNSNG